MKPFKRDILLFPYAFLVLSLTVGLMFLSVLGNKERLGYLEVMSKEGNAYGVRIKYYNKVFRNSDIYSVIIDNSSLPDEFKNIKWNSDMGPFGDMISDKEISLGSKIDNISYKLKVKKNIYNYAFLIIFVLSFFLFFRNMLNITVINPLFYITLLSILSFIYYCYGYGSYWIHWDSNYVFDRYVLNNNPPDNWMGFLYPYIWNFLYNIFHTKNIIAIFQNFLFWISMPTIYLCLFEKKENKLYYVVFYIVYAFPISVIIQLNSITNNMLTTCFVAFSLAFYSLFIKFKKKLFLVLSFFVLLSIAFVRREAILMVLPFAYLIGYSLSNKKRFAIISIFVMLLLFISINKIVTGRIKNYDSGINSVALITVFDISGMSAIKGELLLPDKILKEEYRGENRYKVINALLEVKKYIYNDVVLFMDKEFRHYLANENVYKLDIELGELFKIYINNIPYYILFRTNLAIRYYSMFIFLLVCFVISYKLYKNKKVVTDNSLKNLVITAIFAGISYFILLLVSVVSYQERYIAPSKLLIWIVSILMLYQLFLHKWVVVNKNNYNK